MKARRIREQYLYGTEYTHGYRRAQAIRVDTCCAHWSVFAFIGTVPQQRVGPDRVSEKEAKAFAKQWVQESS